MTKNTLLKTAAVLVMAMALALVGCEGDEGPAGPAGPTGPTGPEGPPGDDGDDATISEYTFVGQNGEACSHCHVTTVEDVLATGHTHAYDNMDAEDRENPYCLQCHTVGWDRHVTFGSDDWMDAENPDENGYDDYFDVEGDEAAERRMDLAGVQCENCHGAMGPDFNDHRPLMELATMGTHDPDNITADDIVSPCYPCHSTQFAGPAGDFNDAYVNAGHANVGGGDLDVFNAEHYIREGCNDCHSNEGFIRVNDPAFASYDWPAQENWIGCVTCHDPHKGDQSGGNPAQLRNLNPVELAFTGSLSDEDPGPVMDGYGNGQLCAQCHHARRDSENVFNQIENGYGHFGPHHSAQADLFIGAGCWEIDGYTYDGTHTHNTGIANGCISCHMTREVVLHGEEQDVAIHSFEPTIENGCATCHPGIDQAYIDTYHAEIEGLLDDIATRLGHTDYHDMEENWDSQADGILPWQREAAYAAYFVIGDGSLGVHNPDYTRSLLNNAIDYYDSNK